MSRKKEQSLSEMKARPKVPHYSPFEREQMRWALQAYRLKNGISWEYYPDELRAVLGLQRGDPGINDKDPKSFVLFLHEPKDEKLFLFQQFIQKVCPEHLRSLAEHGLLTQTAEGLFSFFALNQSIRKDFDKLCEFTAKLRKLFYAQDYFVGGDLPLWSFKPMGVTPFLQVHRFELWASSIPREAFVTDQQKLKTEFFEQTITAKDVRTGAVTFGFGVPLSYGGSNSNSLAHYLVLVRGAANTVWSFGVHFHTSRGATSRINATIAGIEHNPKSSFIGLVGGTNLPFENRSLADFVATLGTGVI